MDGTIEGFSAKLSSVFWFQMKWRIKFNVNYFFNLPDDAVSAADIPFVALSNHQGEVGGN